MPQKIAAQSDFKGELCGGANLELQPDQCADPCVERNSSGDCTRREAANSSEKLNDLIATIVNILSVIVGIVAVIMIIWGGFKFVTSGGDSNQVASARQTIIYAIVGLLIVAFAQIFVRFILDRVA